MEDSIKLEQAMDDEMRSLEKNDTWVLIELPVGKRALLNKWVFRIKTEPDGKRRFKARLVVKVYSQRKGIDYAEIFSYCEVNLYSNSVECCCIGEFASRANGCKNSIFTWRYGQRDLYATTERICGSRQGTHGVQAHQKLVWTKASTKAVVQEV